MFLRYVVTAAILTSPLVLTSPAKAQVTFSNTSPGALTISLDGRTLQSSVAGSTDVTVDAGTTAVIGIEPPVLVSGPRPDPGGTTRVASASVGGVPIDSNSGNTTPLPAGAVTNITINLQVTRPYLFPAGAYQYDVILSVNVN